jgi:hypothetical protein
MFDTIHLYTGIFLTPDTMSFKIINASSMNRGGHSQFCALDILGILLDDSLQPSNYGLHIFVCVMCLFWFKLPLFGSN